MRYCGLLLALCGCVGCYDLTFDVDDHIISDFSVIAVHLEPPEIRPGVPIMAEVIYADPRGEGRVVWLGWQIDVADLDSKHQVGVLTQLKSAADNGAQMRLPVIWPTERDKGAFDFYAFARIYLCAGEWGYPEAFPGSGGHPYTDLCEGGPLLIATKSIGAYDPVFPQNNPAIEGTFLNGVALVPVDEGGEGRVRCRDRASCNASQVLELYISEESLEPFGVATETVVASNAIPTDAASARDAGDSSAEQDESWLNWEVVQVDWYVTGGKLSPSKTYYAASAGRYFGPYSATWRPSGVGVYTLWAVVRDIRGGNAYASYRIVVEESSEKERR